MTAHQLAKLLLNGPDDEVYLSPNVAPVYAIEQCPGDGDWVDPYIVIRGGTS